MMNVYCLLSFYPEETLGYPPLSLRLSLSPRPWDGPWGRGGYPRVSVEKGEYIQYSTVQYSTVQYSTVHCIVLYIL